MPGLTFPRHSRCARTRCSNDKANRCPLPDHRLGTRLGCGRAAPPRSATAGSAPEFGLGHPCDDAYVLATPMRSISTSASFTSNPVVPVVVRAGGVSKYSFHTSSKPLKVRRSVRKTCALTTSARELSRGFERALEIVEYEPGLQLDVGAVVGEARMALRLRRHA